MAEGGISTEPQSISGAKDAPKTQEAAHVTRDAVLVFGQGPVVSQNTREKAESSGEKKGYENINFWSKSLANASAELYKRGEVREIIIMGGKTGGAEYLSESDLIAKELEETYGIPKEAIKREARSTNTLENLVNVLNDYPDIASTQKRINILAANYHLSRVRLLMQIFDIPYKTAFSAEEVMRYAAGSGLDFENQRPQTLLELEKRLDMGQVSKTPVSESDRQAMKRYGYYEGQQGTEQKTILRRAQEEDVFSKALLEMPEYWLPYLGRLTSGERMRGILAKQDSHALKDRFNIDLQTDDDAVLRTKLLTIERKLPDMEAVIGKDWTNESNQKLEQFIAERKQKSTSGS